MTNIQTIFLHLWLVQAQYEPGDYPNDPTCLGALECARLLLGRCPRSGEHLLYQHLPDAEIVVQILLPVGPVHSALPGHNDQTSVSMATACNSRGHAGYVRINVYLEPGDI